MLRITQRKLDTITPYGRNPREISDAAVANVAASIAEFGFKQPIVVDVDGVIIAGHTRYRAAQKLKLEKVPVHVASDLSADQARAYRIRDNQSGELSQWDDDLMGLELTAMHDDGIDLAWTGFDADDLAQWLDLNDGENSDAGEGQAGDGDVKLGRSFVVLCECPDEGTQKGVFDLIGKKFGKVVKIRLNTIE